MSRTALLLIDLQQAFFAIPEITAQRKPLLAAINRLAAEFQAAEQPIWNVYTEHQPGRATWTLNMLEHGQAYLLAGSPEAALVSELQLPANADNLVKTRDSAFFGTPLADNLRQQDVSTLVLAGVTTHSCIAQTATDAYAHNFRIIIPTEAVASNQPALAEATLRLLELEYHQTITSQYHLAKTD
jgi:nicotinamidase-related amidase